jgi:hypothetical protein
MLFSEQFGVTKTAEDTWFDPVMNVDTRLFIDPFLIYADERGPFVGSHDEVIAFFGSAFQMLAQCRGQKEAPAYRKTVGNLAFPEVEEFCLGYTATGTRGAGSGGKLAEAMAEALWEAIQAGIENLNHFELVAILRVGIGADRISDITAAILRKRFVEYTVAVCQRHPCIPRERKRYPRGWYDLAKGQWVPIHAELPVNPRNGKAVLLTPREYLRSLPTLNAEDFWEGYGNAENELLRANVNHDISSRVKKADIVKFAREHPDKLIQYARDKEAAGSDPYDFDQDEAGLVSWHAPTQTFCQANPLGGDVGTVEGLRSFLLELPNAFARFIEDYGGWQHMWAGRRHRTELAAQNLFLGVVMHYCQAKQVTADSFQNIGRKSVLFTAGGGVVARALFEVKLARNGKLRASLAREKPRYSSLEGQDVACLIVVELEEKDFERLTELRRLVAEFDADARPQILPVSAEHEASGPDHAGSPVTVIAGDGSNFHIGDIMGDRINVGGDVTGSAVGSGAVLWARDITTFKNTVDSSTALSAELKQKLTQARDLIEGEPLSPGDKGDAVDALGKMAEELQKPQHDEGRLKRLWENIKGIAPAAASVLASSVEIAKLIGLGS